jgi:hypothetical protein
MGNDNLRLIPVPAHQVDYAWADGADCLGESCVDECTIEQLKFILSKGERQLVRMDEDGKTKGWGVFKVDVLPNMRVFFVTNLVARNAGFERYFEALELMAKDLGCSRIRCAAKQAQARIYESKLGFKPVYTTLERVIVCST